MGGATSMKWKTKWLVGSFMAIGVLIVMFFMYRWIECIYAVLPKEKGVTVISENRFVPPCDTAIIREEFFTRKKALVDWRPNWVNYGRDEWSISLQLPNDRNVDCAAKGLVERIVMSGLTSGDIMEVETFKSGRKVYVSCPDVPFGCVDSICEGIEIEFHYCQREVKYAFSTGLEIDSYRDVRHSRLIDRPQADSILKSWGIKRVLPPEDFDWHYREAQLWKVEEKERKKK
jgi:hypothetical protein